MDTTKPGLWTMDWTMDWAFLIEMSCLTVSWFAAWPIIETWAAEGTGCYHRLCNL